jgi:hypothetical protein
MIIYNAEVILSMEGFGSCWKINSLRDGTPKTAAWRFLQLAHWLQSFQDLKLGRISAVARTVAYEQYFLRTTELPAPPLPLLCLTVYRR